MVSSLVFEYFKLFFPNMSFKLVYQTNSIIMATSYTDTPLCKWKDSNVLAYAVKIQRKSKNSALTHGHIANYHYGLFPYGRGRLCKKYCFM